MASWIQGGTNRVLGVEKIASGKGVNVAIAARRLGLSSRLIGFMYRDGGPALIRRLEDEDVPCEGVWLEGAMRENIKILDHFASVVTELNEAGTPVSSDDVEALAALMRKAPPEETGVLTGSVPPGCPQEIYRELVLSLNARGTFCALDASGEALRLALGAGPALVKPNRDELEQAVGHALKSLADVREAAFGLCRAGVGMVVASLGSEGALIADAGCAFFAPAIPVKVTTTVGAGDAMLAGVLRGRADGLPMEGQLAFGLAAAALTVAGEPLSLSRVSEWAEHVQVRAEI